MREFWKVIGVGPYRITLGVQGGVHPSGWKFYGSELNVPGWRYWYLFLGSLVLTLGVVDSRKDV